jgi:hypothetical protein
MTPSLSQGVSRRYSFPVHAGKRSAFLCTGDWRYRYIDDQRLESPKEWFRSNIKSILKIYGKEHCLQKEDVYLGKCVAICVPERLRK